MPLARPVAHPTPVARLTSFARPTPVVTPVSQPTPVAWKLRPATLIYPPLNPYYATPPPPATDIIGPRVTDVTDEPEENIVIKDEAQEEILEVTQNFVEQPAIQLKRERSPALNEVRPPKRAKTIQPLTFKEVSTKRLKIEEYA